MSYNGMKNPILCLIALITFISFWGCKSDKNIQKMPTYKLKAYTSTAAQLLRRTYLHEGDMEAQSGAYFSWPSGGDALDKKTNSFDDYIYKDLSSAIEMLAKDGIVFEITTSIDTSGFYKVPKFTATVTFPDGHKMSVNEKGEKYCDPLLEKYAPGVWLDKKLLKR